MSNFKDLKTHIKFSAEKMQKVNLFETEHFFCDVYCLQPGQSQKPHRHDNADKVYYVLSGSGRLLIGEEERDVKENEICLAAAGLQHGVVNTGAGPLTLLVFMSPNPNYPKSP